MATKLQKIRWDLYLAKSRLLFQMGLKSGMIHPYENEIIENTRNIYCGGIPASILLMYPKLYNGQCFEQALLIALGLGENENWKIVEAEIDEIVLNPFYIDSNAKSSNSDHNKYYFVERRLNDGTVWIYDSRTGLVYAKNLFYLMQRPKVFQINSKLEITSFSYYDSIKNGDIESDKKVLTFIIPYIEQVIMHSHSLYREKLLAEIELFKKKTYYAELVQEMSDTVKL